MKKKKSTTFSIYKESVAGYVFILPFIIGFLAFSAIPIIISFGLSFTEYDVLGTPKFIGIGNYVRMFTDDVKVWKTFGVTFFYAVVSVPLKLAMALFVALLFTRTTRFSGFMRGVYYLPSIMGGSIAVAVLWRRLFASDGVINAILSFLGMPGDIAWLGRKDTAIWTLILLSVWQFGSSMLIFLAGLKQIPASLYEAAMVDGCSRVRQFFKITLPMLTPVLFFNLVQQMINAFMAFTQSYIITNGGPRDSTRFYCVYQYQRAFEFHEMGYASAMAWFMLAVIGILTALIFRSSTKWVYNESKEG
ncbi:MAG: sugar ABC transporter permease [Lacrimispora sp.]